MSLDSGEIKTEYMTFKRVLSPARKTETWTIINNHGGYELGNIAFLPAWRQYVFRPSANTEYNASCLGSIMGLLHELNKDQRTKLQAAKA